MMRYKKLAHRQAVCATFDERAAVHGHGFIFGAAADDRPLCMCGWQGTPYWDSGERARAEWEQHVCRQHGDADVILKLFSVDG